MNRSVIFAYAVIFGLLMACQAPLTSSSGLAPSEPGQASSTTRNPVLSSTRQASSFPLAAASASPQKRESPASAAAETRSLVTEASPKPNTTATAAPSPTPTPEPNPEPTPAPTATPAYTLQLQIPTTSQFDFRMEQKIDSSWAQKTANDLITEVENEAVYRLQITPEETDYRVNWVPTALTRRVYQLNKGDRTLLRESNGLEIPSPIGQPTAQPSMLPLESQNLEATISAKGKLRSVDLESLWRKVLEAFPLAQLPAEMLETLTGPENKARIFVLLEANIQRHFDTFFGMYPDTAVSQGDSWQARQSLSSLLLGENVAGAEIKPKGTPRWRLARTGKELELHYTGNLNLQISGQSEEISAREIATLMLDPETGLMQSLDFAIEVNLQRNHPHKPLEIHFQRF